MKTAWGIALLLVAQIIAWFQSNSGIIGGKLSLGLLAVNYPSITYCFR
jgi:hypothetical protein